MDSKDKRIAELESLLKVALEENTTLKARIAVLEKNSSTSSLPPSSDIVKPPKKTPKNGKKRKQGVQKGHKRNIRKPFAPEQVDKVVELKLNACPKCGDKLVPTGETKRVTSKTDKGSGLGVFVRWKRRYSISTSRVVAWC